MPTETGFDPQWLEERFRFDAKARNALVEKACMNAFAQSARLNIVDVGSGTGSGCLYLMEQIPQPQEWTFLELNPRLLEVSLDRLTAHAQEREYPFYRKNGQLHLQLPGRSVTIRPLHGSLLDIERLVDLHQVQLITAGGLFDLFSEEMFQEVAHALIRKDVALLATLNYTGMSFYPARPFDAKYIELYHQHMHRSQSFGRAMGPECRKKMLAFYSRMPISIISGESNWQVEPDDLKMQTYLLDFIDRAGQELLDDRARLVLFNTWMREKRQMVENLELKTTVRHSDLFVWQKR